jgi:hypothetical protein
VASDRVERHMLGTEVFDEMLRPFVETVGELAGISDVQTAPCRTYVR